MNESLKYTCLFGGGAIRGLSYIGTIKAFEELGIYITTLGGSSVGSIFAALLAVGYTSDELNHIFSKVNFNLFRDISIGLGPLFALSKGEVFLDWVREQIESKFYGENYQKGTNPAVTFKDLKKELVIITTDLGNFECKEFSKNATPDYEVASAVRISCCMPGLMKPIEYNNRLLVDGDLQKSWPMWKLSETLKKSKDRILELRLEGYYENNDISGIDYANAVYSCMTASSTAFVTNIYGKKDRYDYIVLNTGDIVIVDFNINEEKRKELVQSGYNQTINYMTKTLPAKKEELLGFYETISRHLQKVSKYINSNKIYKGRIQLGELYVDLCSFCSIIDKNDYLLINSFKDLYNDNIKHPALFGKVKLKNETLVKSELSNLMSSVNKKIVEYTEYLAKCKNNKTLTMKCL